MSITQKVGFNDGRFALLLEKICLCTLRPRPQSHFKARNTEILRTSSTFYDIRCFKQ